MTDLTEFLLSRIAEDEAVAREYDEFLTQREADLAEMAARGAMPGIIVFRFTERGGPGDPARVLATCAAYRTIVERCGGVGVGYPSHHLAQGALRALASAYADHPDYREGWRP